MNFHDATAIFIAYLSTIALASIFRRAASPKKFDPTERKTSPGSWSTAFRRRKVKSRCRARKHDIKADFYSPRNRDSRDVHTRGSSQWAPNIEWSTVSRGWRNYWRIPRSPVVHSPIANAANGNSMNGSIFRLFPSRKSAQSFVGSTFQIP